MLLIDAIYINQGGGFVLLRYLLDVLKERDIDFFLLADGRCRGKLEDVANIQYMRASLKGRWEFYQKMPMNITSVLCFGNVPPPIRLDVPVYTYFHNINMLTLDGWPSWLSTAITFAKREYIRMHRGNTEKWIVQTSNTKNELLKHLENRPDKVLIYPFYDLSHLSSSNFTMRTDYSLVGNYNNGAKGHDVLLKAWEILAERSYYPTLHLTISDGNEMILKRLEILQKSGLKIINHGIVPFKEIAEIYNKSKAIIYPSINESLGLGIVEAIHSGCDVIASDLPFVHSICIPSIVFDRSSAESVADAVIRYESSIVEKSHLKINDMVDELIDLIV